MDHGPAHAPSFALVFAAHSPLQSIIATAPEADALVDGFRLEGDWARLLGIPAHLTLAGPWPLDRELPDERLSRIAAEARGTRYQLDSIDRLGDAICLLPRDDKPLIDLRARLLDAVGSSEASPEWRPHLTIYRGESRDRLASIRKEIEHALPLDCEVEGLYLARLIEPGRAVMEAVR